MVPKGARSCCYFYPYIDLNCRYLVAVASLILFSYDGTMSENVMKLDLGAGTVKRKGYFSVDRIPAKGVDIVCDVEKKLPFRDNSVDEVFSRHLFEHIRNLIQLFEEVYRICKPGARVLINVPYYTSIKAFKDPTHVNWFTEKTFEYFEGKSWENFEFPFKGSFRVKKIDYLYQRPFHKFIPFMGFWRRILMNTVTSMIAELEVIK